MVLRAQRRLDGARCEMARSMGTVAALVASRYGGNAWPELHGASEVDAMVDSSAGKIAGVVREVRVIEGSKRRPKRGRGNLGSCRYWGFTAAVPRLSGELFRQPGGTIGEIGRASCRERV